MPISELENYIFFIPEHQCALVVFQKEKATEPLYSLVEILSAIRGLHKDGLIDALTSEVLQFCALSVPIRRDGVRMRLTSEGVRIQNVQLLPPDTSSERTETDEPILPRPTWTM